MQIEKTILKNLTRNEAFTRRVMPFLKDEYFSQDEDRLLFREIKSFVEKYNTTPTYDALSIEVDNLANLTEQQVKSLKDTLRDIHSDQIDTNVDWLMDTTEKFCQEKAIYNAIVSSIDIMNNKNGTTNKGAIPQMLSDALAVSFDPNVGHDYMQDFNDRFEYYHKVQERVPFDLEFFNKITRGGLPKKTLNIALAGCVHPSTKVKIRFRKKVS